MSSTYYKVVCAYITFAVLWFTLPNIRVGKVSYSPKPESIDRVAADVPRVRVDRVVNEYKPAVDFLSKVQVLPPIFSEALRGPVKPASPKMVSGVCPPVREPLRGNYPPILKELYSRVDEPHRFRDPTDPTDLVTWTHELTHGASNQVWNKKGKQGLYMLDGKGVILTHPDITMEQIARSISPDKRGKIYQLYLVEQRRWWNDSPIYLCDEWLAYTHGAIAHKQMGWEDRRKDTYRSAREMESYVREMVKVIERRDPGYPEMDQLKKFVEYQSRRLPK